jgi:F0F1-type ATP synthase assembly protein I
MTPGEKQSSPAQDSQRALNLALASAAGLGGCLVVIVVIGALIGGLWLDSVLKTRPLFTLVLVIGSMPVGIFVMYRVAMSAVARIKPASAPTPRAKAKPEENEP